MEKRVQDCRQEYQLVLVRVQILAADGKVYAMLIYENASKDEIVAYLRNIEREWMGLDDVDQLRSKRAADILVALRPEFEREPDEPSNGEASDRSTE